MDKGYFQIYTGDGKGKTTAAIGLAARAAGAGMRVYIGQFIKSIEYNEIKMLRERFPEITIELYGDKGCIYKREADETDLISAKKGLASARKALTSGQFDVVILDEIMIGIHFSLFDVNTVLSMVDDKAPKTEVVMTGRYAPESLIDRANLVTEMKNIRHYYNSGVQARDGIER